MDEKMEWLVNQALIKDIDRWVDASLFGANPKYLHVIVIGDDAPMLLVAKQMALLAHFPTFDETNPDTRTRISILGKVSADDEWKKPFGNLLSWQTDWIKVPLDIELEHIALTDDATELKTRAQEWIAENASPRRVQVVYDADTIESLKAANNEVFSDEKREMLAKRANMVYEASLSLDNIEARDVSNVMEYRTPVKNFLTIDDEVVEGKWSSLDEDLKYSNYYLVDSLLVRIASLRRMKTSQGLRGLFGRDLYQRLEENLLPMSQSEHARWNVEKLIDHFRPFTESEELTDNGIQYPDERKKYRNRMKRENKVHIDLCSYENLERKDINAVKYDSFLLLALVKYYESKVR